MVMISEWSGEKGDEDDDNDDDRTVGNSVFQFFSSPRSGNCDIQYEYFKNYLVSIL